MRNSQIMDWDKRIELPDSINLDKDRTNSNCKFNQTFISCDRFDDNSKIGCPYCKHNKI